jgi:hypothetical protein
MCLPARARAERASYPIRALILRRITLRNSPSPPCGAMCGSHHLMQRKDGTVRRI